MDVNNINFIKMITVLLWEIIKLGLWVFPRKYSLKKEIVILFFYWQKHLFYVHVQFIQKFRIIFNLIMLILLT